MTLIHFDTAFLGGELQGVDLPIQIRRPDLTLVRRTTAHQPVDLDPGRYMVCASLPAGQQLIEQVEVRNESQRVLLKPAEEDNSPHESHEIQHFLVHGLPSQVAGMLETFGPGDVQTPLPEVRLFEGNLLSGGMKMKRRLRPPPEYDRLSTLQVEGSDTFRMAEVRQAARPVLYLALPAAEYGKCILAFTLQEDGSYVPEVHLGHPEANLLLRYSEKARMEEAAATARSLERLLRDKIDDPIAAAVGAYGLLRFDDLERLHDWTANLRNWFTWLPDGAAIHAEHSARLGDHDAAMNALRELSTRGVPLFSDGLSYAVERLQLYLEPAGRHHFGARILADAEQLLGKLQRFIPRVDFTKGVLAFSGDIADLVSAPAAAGAVAGTG